MRKILAAAAAALTLAGGLVATTSPALAQTRGFHGGGFHGGGWHGGGGHYHGGGWGYGAAALGGLALGAALASPGYYGYGYGPYYNGYYGGYYGGGGYYGQCVGTQRVWDPYYGGYTIRRYYYAC